MLLRLWYVLVPTHKIPSLTETSLRLLNSSRNGDWLHTNCCHFFPASRASNFETLHHYHLNESWKGKLMNSCHHPWEWNLVAKLDYRFFLLAKGYLSQFFSYSFHCSYLVRGGTKPCGEFFKRLFLDKWIVIIYFVLLAAI